MWELMIQRTHTCKCHYRSWLVGGNYCIMKFLKLSQVYCLDIFNSRCRSSRLSFVNPTPAMVDQFYLEHGSELATDLLHSIY